MASGLDSVEGFKVIGLLLRRGCPRCSVAARVLRKMASWVDNFEGFKVIGFQGWRVSRVLGIQWSFWVSGLHSIEGFKEYGASGLHGIEGFEESVLLASFWGGQLRGF